MRRLLEIRRGSGSTKNKEGWSVRGPDFRREGGNPALSSPSSPKMSSSLRLSGQGNTFPVVPKGLQPAFLILMPLSRRVPFQEQIDSHCCRCLGGPLGAAANEPRLGREPVLCLGRHGIRRAFRGGYVADRGRVASARDDGGEGGRGRGGGGRRGAPGELPGGRTEHGGRGRRPSAAREEESARDLSVCDVCRRRAVEEDEGQGRGNRRALMGRTGRHFESGPRSQPGSNSHLHFFVFLRPNEPQFTCLSSVRASSTCSSISNARTCSSKSTERSLHEMMPP